MASRSSFISVALLTALAAAISSGCGPSTGSSNPDEKPTPSGNPRELLDKVLAGYAKAASYRDKGTLRLRYQIENETLEEATQVSLAFQRPTMLRLNFDRPSMQISVASDGKQIQAKVVHPETRDFDGQFVSRPVPEELTVGHVFAATEYRDVARPAQMISLLDGMRINLDELPLALLLAKKAFGHLLGDGAKLRFLPDHGHGGKDVRRIALATADGDYVFWIDETKLTLVQLEYPNKKLMEEIAGGSTGKVQDVSFALDLSEVELGAMIDDAAFKLDSGGVPPQQHFVYPPPPLPSPSFGKDVGDLSLSEITGKDIPRESLNGKITTFLWWQNHESCRVAMQQLELVYQTYRSNPKLAFWAVCTEPGSTKPGQIAAILHHWKVNVPGARDLKAQGRDLLGISQAPCLVVTDAEGKLQIFEVGANPRLSQELPIILQRMLHGDKLSEEIVRRHELDKAEYERSLAVARGEKVDVPPLAEGVPARTEPTRMKIAPAWNCTELKSPGNFLVVSTPDAEPAVLVLEGTRTVAQLTADGQVRARLPLPIPEGEGVTFLRTGVDQQGNRYYAASSMLGRKLYVFNAKWQLLVSYPDPSEKHDGIKDVLLADLAGDGDMECYVGFWGLVGTQAIDFKGKRLWSNRTATPVLSLTTIPGGSETERQLIVTSDRGLLLPIAAGGREVKAFQVGQRAIHQLIAASFPPPRSSGYLGLSYTPEGQLYAVALGDGLSEAWAYPLPKGAYLNTIEFMTSANFGILGSGEWLLAGPDGSVHVISHNGDFFDSFRSGKVLTGIAGIKSGGKKLLLMSSKEGVEAVEILEAK